MDFLAKTALTQHIKIGRKRNGQNGGSLLRKKHKEQRRKQPPTCKMKYNTVSNSRDFQPIARKKTPPDPDVICWRIDKPTRKLKGSTALAALGASRVG